jgi:GTP-binding protein HflX
VSARRGDGIDALLSRIETTLAAGLTRVEWAVPLDRGDVLAALHRGGQVLAQQACDGVLHVTALVPPKLAGQLRHAVSPVRGACS